MLTGRIDDIDMQIDKIHKLISSASRDDLELASGIGSSESLGSIQRKIDQASAACEDLHSHIQGILATR